MGSWSGPSGCARTSSAGLGLHASSRVLARPRRGGRHVARGGLRGRPARRAAGRRRAARRSTTCSPSTRPSPARLSLASLDACFDDATFLRHVPEVIGRLDVLSSGLESRRSRAGLAAAPGRCPMPAADAFVRSGKVRDLYQLDDDRLLLVASDRVSAFDVVLPTRDPRQGPRPDRPLALLVRRDRRDRRQPPRLDRPRRRPGRLVRHRSAWTRVPVS